MKKGLKFLGIFLVFALCLVPMGAMAMEIDLGILENTVAAVEEAVEEETPAEAVEETPVAEVVEESETLGAASVVASGYCGYGGAKNLAWTITDDGVLTISGTGRMQDYSEFDNGSVPRPWAEYGYTSLVIEEGVTQIGEFAFKGCEAPTVALPEGLEIVGPHAFEGAAIESISFPSTLRFVQYNAFCGCGELVEIDFGSALVSFGENVFRSSSVVKNIYVDSVEVWLDCAFENEYSNPLCVWGVGNLYVGGELLTKLVVPDGMTSISSYAFDGYTLLESVKMSDSVTEIGQYAFRDCTGLKELSLGESVESLNGFTGCTGLTEVDIPDSVTYIGANAFRGCIGLTEIEIPDGVMKIGSFAFSECSNLVSVQLPKGLDQIGQGLFMECDSLTDVNVPETVTEIGDMAFKSCVALRRLELPEKMTSIGSEAFYYCTSLAELNIPDSVTTIENKAFMYCAALTEISIPKGVSKIQDHTFSNCTSLSEVQIPEWVTYIGEYAFYACEGLEEVTVPESVEYVMNYAFHYCSSLEKVTILNSECYIGDSSWTLGKAEINSVCGYTGSTAEEYAAKYNYVFIPIDQSLFVFGDVTGNGMVNSIDLVRLMKYIVGATEDVVLSACDMNGDETHDILDIICFVRYLVEREG